MIVSAAIISLQSDQRPSYTRMDTEIIIRRNSIYSFGSLLFVLRARAHSHRHTHTHIWGPLMAFATSSVIYYYWQVMLPPQFQSAVRGTNNNGTNNSNNNK